MHNVAAHLNPNRSYGQHMTGNHKRPRHALQKVHLLKVERIPHVLVQHRQLKSTSQHESTAQFPPVLGSTGGAGRTNCQHLHATSDC